MSFHGLCVRDTCSVAVFYLFLEITARKLLKSVLGLTKHFAMKRALFFSHSNTWHNKCLRDTFFMNLFFLALVGIFVNHVFVLMVFLKKQYV